MPQPFAEHWNALSALYEEADELSGQALADWLTALGRQAHPLLPQLRRMLEARARLETDDFLGTLPKLPDAAPDPAPRWSAGSRVGPYQLIRPLGEGGMAEVWLADRADGAFSRRVAIKLPFPRAGREGLAARFDRERDILASLRHPHIAGLLDAGVTTQGQAWLALECVDGEPLSIHCDRLKMPVRERLSLFRQVLLAVQHAHANLVIHRDLKPGNILVTANGEARLLDFGIAKLLEAEGGSTAETEITRLAGRSLTPRYASPEQIDGRPLTIACDVYALGVILYELLCGERPYDLKSDSIAQLEQAILEQEPRAPSRRAASAERAADRGVTPAQLRRTLSPELDAIVLRCLSKPVAARYSSVDALLADVDRWLAGEAVLARAPSAWYRFGKFTARHRTGMAFGAIGLLALVGMTVVATLSGLQARQDSARAVASRDFMLELFRGADREKSRGADITARELLQAGRREAIGRLGDQPRLQTELLAGIASIQVDMGEYASADATFADAARIASGTGQATALATALAGQADTAVRLGDWHRAMQLVGNVRRSTSALDGDVEALVEKVEGWVAAYTDRPDEALRHFTRARELVTAAHGANAPAAIDALLGAIRVERQRLRYDTALGLQRDLESMVRNRPDVKPRELAALDYRRSDLVYAAGRFAQGWPVVSAASDECAATLGSYDDVCRQIALVKAKTRMRMGFSDLDAGDADVKLVDALAADAQMPIQRADALYVLLRLVSARGGSARPQALEQRVQDVIDADAGLNAADGIKLSVGLAEAALATGDFPLAARRADQALKKAALHAGPSARATPWTATATLVSGISARLSGRPLEALQRLTVARDDICRLVGADHAMCRIYRLDIAVALADLGRTPEAVAIVRQEKAGLLSDFGDDAPVYRRFLAFERALSDAQPGAGGDRPERAPLPHVFI